MHLNGMTDETRIDELVADLRRGPLAVRRAATAELGASGAVAVEPLIAAMLDNNNNLRWYAARALVQIDETAIDPLLTAMRAGENRDFRRYAMAALAGIGEAAVEPLIDIIECADPALQPFAAMALMKIGEPAVEPLLRLMQSPDPKTQERAALLLCRMGETGAEPLTGALEADRSGKR